MLHAGRAPRAVGVVHAIATATAGAALAGGDTLGRGTSVAVVRSGERSQASAPNLVKAFASACSAAPSDCAVYG